MIQTSVSCWQRLSMVGFAAAAFGAFTLGVLTSTSARGFLEKGGSLALGARLQQLVENLSAPAQSARTRIWASRLAMWKEQ